MNVGAIIIQQICFAFFPCVMLFLVYYKIISFLVYIIIVSRASQIACGPRAAWSYEIITNHKTKFFSDSFMNDTLQYSCDGITHGIRSRWVFIIYNTWSLELSLLTLLLTVLSLYGICTVSVYLIRCVILQREVFDESIRFILIVND